jgi:hypothetical protein
MRRIVLEVKNSFTTVFSVFILPEKESLLNLIEKKIIIFFFAGLIAGFATVWEFYPKRSL